jgi:peptidoglycan/LPS O-acetylase OafA/YrhL
MDRAGYRPEVDGLRAFAVLAVLLFHLGLPYFGGGFVGVDVFFVISGFVITRLIDRELKSGEFTFTGFYIRRIRRLFPALFVTLASTVLRCFFDLYGNNSS